MLFLLLVGSCKNFSVRQSFIADDYNAAEVVMIPELKDSALKYSDFCSRVDYIPLEATDQSLIGILSSVEIASDGSIIVYDGLNSSLLRFGSDGRFLNRIGNIGRMDTEYLQITSYAYNSFKDEFIVWDSPTHSLLYYDLNGQFLRRSEIKWWSGKICVIDENHLAFYLRDKANSYKYVITTYDGNEIIAEFPDNEPSPLSDNFHIHYLYRHNGQTFSKSQFSSNIYQINENGLSSAYYISYANGTIPQKWFSMPSKSFNRQLKKHRSSLVYCAGAFGSTNYYFILTAKYPFSYMSVQERYGTGRTFSGFFARNDLFDDVVINLRLSTPGSVNLKLVYGDAAFFEISGSQYLEDDYRRKSEEIRLNVADSTERSLALAKWEEYYKICQNENPVLLKCTLK